MTQPLYPLVFEPIFKEKPWGGDRLRSLYRKPFPPHLKIGESWEIADRGADSTAVSDGFYRGKTLHDLIAALEYRLLGDRIWARGCRRFPLLFKMLDVEALLSVQVHPGDGDAGGADGDGDGGKTEMWHILWADGGASVICGLQEGVGPRKFRRYLDSRQVEKILRYFPARAGESFFIPPGRVHTVGPSCVIVEVQQNSDVTYRVYDWGRMGLDGRPRRLHVEEACSVIDFADADSPVLDPVWEQKGDVRESILVACPEFTVERFDLEGTYGDECRGRHFQVLTGIEGEAVLEAGCAPGLSRKLEPGSFLLLPAYLGEYRIRPAGRFSFLKSYVT